MHTTYGAVIGFTEEVMIAHSEYCTEGTCSTQSANSGLSEATSTLFMFCVQTYATLLTLTCYPISDQWSCFSNHPMFGGLSSHTQALSNFAGFDRSLLLCTAQESPQALYYRVTLESFMVRKCLKCPDTNISKLVSKYKPYTTVDASCALHSDSTLAH